MSKGTLASICAAMLAALAFGAAPAAAQVEQRSVLLYTGTTGFRHADAINQGQPVVQDALEDAGYTVDWEDCDNNGGGANDCDNPDKNARIFTDENLAQYDAILLFNASAAWAGGGRPGPLWNADQRAAIIRYVQGGGGIAANHNATDMAAGQVSWDWWDGGPNSAVGSLMKGHAATNQGNVAQVQVADHQHLSTRDLPDTYGFGDEHYNFARSVRGTHHVLATLDERTYAPVNPMGQDHPITWCKLYDGASVDDGTGTPKPYNDGRVWTSGMGHFGSSYTANGGNNEIVKQIVGGVRWVAGEGKKSDCSGTVWSSFKRTILVSDVNGPIGLDVAPDGKVYWTEIGPNQGFTSEGFIKMHDPTGPANNKTTVATILTRADHGNSEDGVLGMSLEPGFDLSDPAKRDVYVYYSPRNPDWPTTGAQIVVGYNQVSRFTINAEGTAIVPDSERVILRVPKAKISGSPSGFTGGPTDSGPGHVGGAGLDFDSDGNLYLGVGDDVSPNAPGHNRYAPMDYRASERWDARKTSANTADLRGKVLRIKPVEDIAAGAEPGAGTTYTIPAGNMFEPGMAQTRPEIYAMGFRQPFTVHTDPANPGTVVVGEYCHDNNVNGAGRAPAGVCEWNLVDHPSFQGWPFCVGDNAQINTMFRWNYATDLTTGQQYDCSLADLPTDLNWAPAGQTAAPPTFQGRDTIPGPATPATIWRKYPGAEGGQNPLDFGDLSAGGQSPVTGPVYRYDADTAGPGAFPPYYDGSWFITNRGDNNGWWKEVRLRSDDNEMLRVNDWVPTGQFGTPNNSFVIPTQFGPDGALYMARWTEGCCRNQLSAGTQTQLVKIEFAVQDECLADTEAPTANHRVEGREHPSKPGTFLEDATLVVTAGDAGCAGIDTIEYRVNSDDEGDWQAYAGPVAFDEPGSYTVDYRATDRFDNVSAVKEATFAVEEIVDHDAPAVSAEVTGSKDDEDHFIAPATLEIEATDLLTSISSIEYRVNQEEAWTKVDFDGENLSETLQQEFAAPSFYFVEFRATDEAGNTSDIGSATFSVVGACEQSRTDEFDGTELDGGWLRHTRNGGTPTTDEFAPTLANGQLTMPTHNLELDGSAGTAAGPVNFLGQDLAELGPSWEVETEFTVEHTGGWQGVGLILWQGDNNFFRSTITHNLGNGTIFVEQSKDNPTSAEGSRVQSGGSQILPAKAPVTIRMRYARVDGANTVTAQYRVLAPESAATPDWVDFPGNAGWVSSGALALNPAGGPRRDAPGSRLGLYAGGNFPDSTGNHPYPGTPANMVVDYFKTTGTVGCPGDVEPPVTTATLDPPGAVSERPVDVTISATDGDDPDASGVDVTEHSVDGGAWQQGTELTVSQEGAHSVRYRSRDEAGNLEVPQTVEFTIDFVRDVFASGTTWNPDELTVPFGDTVTWHFDQPAAQFPHDVWLTPPTGDALQVSNGPVAPDGPPVSYTFRREGSWAYVCRIHSTQDPGTGEWTGMVGTVNVGNPPPPPPDTNPSPPPPSPFTGNPPMPTPPTAAKLSTLPRTTLASFLRKGVRIATRCESGQRGTVRVTLSRSQARKLGLRRATTLASKAVRCGADDRAVLRLKPSAKLKRKLRTARGSVVTKVTVRMGAGADATSHSRRLVLRAPKRR
jgi:plastocyanin